MKKLLVMICLYFTCVHVDGLALHVPKVIEVIERNDAIILCNLTDYNGNVSSLMFYWMRSMVIVQSEQTLRIPLIDSSQAGTYTCYVSIDGQTYTSSVDIIVNYAPKWIEGALRKFSGMVGSQASLDCMVDSFPSPMFTWTSRNNVSITSSSGKYTVNNSDKKSTLTINNLDQLDYGTYNCHAVNRASARTYTIQLLQPGIPDSPQLCRETIIKSDSVTVTCLEGYKGGADQLEYEVKIYALGKSHSQSFSTVGRLNSTTVLLEVTGLTSKQEYTLDVYASNSHGTSTEPISMFVITAPGPVILSTGSPDNSKVVALAVCIPLLFILVVVFSSVALYRWFVRHKKAWEASEALSFQNALSNFPGFSGNHETPNSDLKEFIAPAKDRVDLSFINHAFTRDELRSKKVQPTLAGCGALQALQTIQEPSRLTFVPGKTSTADPRGDNQNVRADTSFPSVSDSWEFPRRNFFLKRKLGVGMFADVWEARLVDSQDGQGGRNVAVKMLRDNFTDDEKQSMLDDMRVMKSVGFHANVLQLIGCCTTSYPLCIILEYTSRGSLLNLLKQQRLNPGLKLTTKDVESFTLQIASAMEHVTSMKLIHRDLAARKVLLSNDFVCKLADFEKELHFQDTSNLYKRESHRVQLRWLPPESLFVMEKSKKSNIWSFGILIWECFNFGSTPYPGMDNKEVIDFVQRGGRMPKPSFCSQTMYEVIQSCWVYYPHKRASFSELKKQIQRIYETNPSQQMDSATGECDSKSWDTGPQDIGEFV